MTDRVCGNILYVLRMQLLICALISSYYCYGQNVSNATYNFALIEAVENQAAIGSTEVKRFLSATNSDDLLWGKPQLTVLIPPYPCSECLNEVLDRLSSFCLNINIVVPSYRKITQFKFNGNVNVRTIAYDISSVTSSAISNFSGIVLFVAGNGAVDDLFLTHKDALDVVTDYLQSINETLNSELFL